MSDRLLCLNKSAVGAWMFLFYVMMCAATVLGQGGEGKSQNSVLEPVSRFGDEASRLVNRWYLEGTAAGNIADVYDNRDRAHSLLDLKQLPQARRVEYTEAQLKNREDWGGQRRLGRGVVIGNSSTSASVTSVGSNTRSMYYTRDGGMKFLYAQYRASNLYVYPEHHDHDVGRNGSPGYGDLFPTNSPYVVISQGSSFSDKAFLKALFLTTAAFRPEVKRMLVAKGMLMPTLQFILRASMVRYPADYLKGEAHPTVFNGKKLLPVKMVTMAHEMTLKNVPPLVQIEVKEEMDVPVAGRDYFEAGYKEQLVDTLSVIGRVFRGVDFERRLVVSAARSLDVEGKALTYHWVVLRGDPKLVKIKPRDGGSVAEISVGYQGRREVEGAGGLESSRVDIGVFVFNGEYYSAPGFVTFYCLENEQRRYSSGGKILEVDYQAGQHSVSINNAGAFFSQLELEGKAGLGWTLIREALSHGPATVYAKRLSSLESLLELSGRRMALKQTQLAGGIVDVELQALDEQIDTLAREDFGKGSESILATINSKLNALLKDATLLSTNREAIDRRINDKGLNAEFTTWETDAEGGIVGVAGDTLHGQRRLAQLNRFVLTRIIYGDTVSYSFKPHFAIQGMGAIKPWMDVYKEEGEAGGWSRYYRDDSVREFDASGRWLKRVGHEIIAVKVNYAVGAGGLLEIKEAAR